MASLPSKGKCQEASDDDPNNQYQLLPPSQYTLETPISTSSSLTAKGKTHQSRDGARLQHTQKVIEAANKSQWATDTSQSLAVCTSDGARFMNSCEAPWDPVGAEAGIALVSIMSYDKFYGLPSNSNAKGYQDSGYDSMSVNDDRNSLYFQELSKNASDNATLTTNHLLSSLSIHTTPDQHMESDSFGDPSPEQSGHSGQSLWRRTSSKDARTEPESTLKRRFKRKFTKDEKDEINLKRKTGACSLCRKKKIKVCATEEYMALNGNLRLSFKCKHVITSILSNNTHTQISDNDSTTSCNRDPKNHGYLEMTTDSTSNGENSFSLLRGNFKLIMSQAKHGVMVNLMKDVYAMFEPNSGVRTRATSASGSSGMQSYQSKSGASSSSIHQNDRKRMQSRDSPPPDDGNGKRRKRFESDSEFPSQGRMLACPLHKFNPHRYSLNSGRGAAYRSCMGPGFKSISRVK